jgi:hypothetical protein
MVLFAAREKLIRSPECALKIASRNVHLSGVHVPVPSSVVLLTMKVAARAEVTAMRIAARQE